MKNTTGIIIGVIVIAGGIYISTQSKADSKIDNKTNTEVMRKDRESDAVLATKDKAMAEKEAMEDNEALKNEADKAPEVADHAEMPVGAYEAYSPDRIAIKAETGNVVLFFHASWCPTCRALDTDIRNNLKNIPASLTIFDVDYDNSDFLKQKYEVTYQHTLVEVDKDGNLIKKWMGSPDLASLIQEVI